MKRKLSTKTDYTCSYCNKIFKVPVILTPCNDYICAQHFSEEIYCISSRRGEECQRENWRISLREFFRLHDQFTPRTKSKLTNGMLQSFSRDSLQNRQTPPWTQRETLTKSLCKMIDQVKMVTRHSLTIYQSKTNRAYFWCGYTDLVPWNSSSGRKLDANAFVFSVSQTERWHAV